MQVDITSIVWVKIRRHINSQIDAHRTTLERCDADRVANLQGRIAELRDLLNTVEPTAPDYQDFTNSEADISGY